VHLVGYLQELNPICHLLALLGVHRILHVSRIRVKINKILIAEAVLSVFENKVQRTIFGSKSER